MKTKTQGNLEATSTVESNITKEELYWSRTTKIIDTAKLDLPLVRISAAVNFTCPLPGFASVKIGATIELPTTLSKQAIEEAYDCAYDICYREAHKHLIEAKEGMENKLLADKLAKEVMKNVGQKAPVEDN